jgi:hypothetical protein
MQLGFPEGSPHAIVPDGTFYVTLVGIEEDPGVARACARKCDCQHVGIGEKRDDGLIYEIREGYGGARRGKPPLQNPNQQGRRPGKPTIPLKRAPIGQLGAGWGKGVSCRNATIDMISDCIKKRLYSSKPFDPLTNNC